MGAAQAHPGRKEALQAWGLCPVGGAPRRAAPLSEGRLAAASPCRLSLEHLAYRLRLDARDQVAIAATHLFRLVSNPTVDQPLVDTSRGSVAHERVPQDVPAAQHFPLAPR